jgi:hypothetical protein
MEEAKINVGLWSKAIIDQTIKSMKCGKLFFINELVELENPIEKHKYFAFRVDDIKEVESNYDLVKQFAAQGGRGLARSMEDEICKLIAVNTDWFEDETLTTYEKTNIIESTLKHIDKLKIFFSSEIRVQAAYDLDYLSTSIVGDIKFKLGFIKDPPHDTD